jgi:hypothetical protein
MVVLEQTLTGNPIFFSCYLFLKSISVSDTALPEGDAQVKLGRLLPLLQV